MFEFTDSAGLPPVGTGLTWGPWLAALHAGADGVIFASYFLIPLAIMRFVRARPDLRLGGIGTVSAAFILLGGLTHLMGLVTPWLALPLAAGLVKLVAAAVSGTTAVLVFRMLPALIALPGPDQLSRANAELEAEIASHRATLGALQAARDELEAKVAERTSELTEANRRLTLVTRETVHRTKNLLTVVQSIARQSAAFAASKEELLEALCGRMTSLAHALSAVIQSGTTGADIGEVVETQLRHYQDLYPGRVRISGPPVMIRPEAAQQIGLAMHELATNAVKHGALSEAGGRLAVTWERCTNGTGQMVRLLWVERLDTPPASRPERPEGSGFGAVLLSRAVPMQLKAKVESGLTEEGYRYELRMPLAELSPRYRSFSEGELAFS